MQFGLFFSEAIVFCSLCLKNVILSWPLRLLYEIFLRLSLIDKAVCLDLIDKAVCSLKEPSASYQLGDFTLGFL